MKTRRLLVVSLCLLGSLACGLAGTAGISTLQSFHNFRETFRSVDRQDGWVLESAEDSWMGGQLNAGSTSLRVGEDSSGEQFRSILSFHTGTLPGDAVITSATLVLKQDGSISGENPFHALGGMLIDVRLGTFGSPELDADDFEAAPDVASLGPYKPPLADTYTFPLSSLGYANINKWSYEDGLTQLRLRFRLKGGRHIGSNYVRLSGGSVDRYISFFSGDAAVESQRPRLIIEYHLPSTQEVGWAQ